MLPQSLRINPLNSGTVPASPAPGIMGVVRIVRRCQHLSDTLGEVCQMNRKGFTLIELLIVVVIIGILAAIAIPKFANTKEKAYLASMKSDLRNLITAEEGYFADSVKYTKNLGTAYNVTSGVVGPTIVVTANGFTATVSHTTTTKTCAVYVGTTALAPANKEGEPKCQ